MGPSPHRVLGHKSSQEWRHCGQLQEEPTGQWGQGTPPGVATCRDSRENRMEQSRSRLEQVSLTGEGWGPGLTGELGGRYALSMLIPWSRSRQHMGSTSGSRPMFPGTSAMSGSSTV